MGGEPQDMEIPFVSFPTISALTFTRHLAFGLFAVQFLIARSKSGLELIAFSQKPATHKSSASLNVPRFSFKLFLDNHFSGHQDDKRIFSQVGRKRGPAFRAK